MALETTERDISIAFEKLAIKSYGGNHPTTIFFRISNQKFLQ